MTIYTSMHAITRDNVDEYLDKLGDRNWGKINFKKYSKKYNTALEKYDFSLESLLNAG